MYSQYIHSRAWPEEAKLKDRRLFQPVPLEKAFVRKRKACEIQRKPKQLGSWDRPQGRGGGLMGI